MRTLGATMTVGLLLLVGVGGAWAEPGCVQEAKDQRAQCRTSCDEDFVMARDLCRNIDPECAAACRVALADCRAPIVSALEGCVDGCRNQLNADRGACPRRSRGRDFCVDRAQIRAFLCRDECRDNLQVRAGLKACNDAFTTCMSGCGLPPEPTAVPTQGPPQPTPVKTEAPHPTETAVPTEVPVPTETPRPTQKPAPVPTFSGPLGPR